MTGYLSLHPGKVQASDLVVIDGWAFVSGLIGADLDNARAPLAESVEAQMRNVLANLERLLARAGMTRNDVVSVRLHLTQYERFFERMNTAYAGFFAADRLPTRSVVGVSHLTRGALVEIDAVARRSAGSHQEGV